MDYEQESNTHMGMESSMGGSVEGSRMLEHVKQSKPVATKFNSPKNKHSKN